MDDSMMVVVSVAVDVVNSVVLTSTVVVVENETVLVTALGTTVDFDVGIVVEVTVVVDPGIVLVYVGLTATIFFVITNCTVFKPISH